MRCTPSNVFIESAACLVALIRSAQYSVSWENMVFTPPGRQAFEFGVCNSSYRVPVLWPTYTSVEDLDCDNYGGGRAVAKIDRGSAELKANTEASGQHEALLLFGDIDADKFRRQTKAEVLYRYTRMNSRALLFSPSLLS